jgi:hypothetical protein
MSQAKLTKPSRTDATGHRAPPTDGTGEASTTKVRRRDIAGVLAAMTFAERIRAYEKGTFTRQELNAAAAGEPERMPMLKWRVRVDRMEPRRSRLVSPRTAPPSDHAPTGLPLLCFHLLDVVQERHRFLAQRRPGRRRDAQLASGRFIDLALPPQAEAVSLRGPRLKPALSRASSWPEPITGSPSSFSIPSLGKRPADTASARACIAVARSASLS